MKSNLQNSGFDTPRRHHYAFAHVLLPELLRSSPQIITQLMSEEGLGLLKTQWAMLGLQVQAEGHEFIPEGVVKKLADIQKESSKSNSKNCLAKYVEKINSDRFAIVIQLPKPQRRTEAFFIAIIAWFDQQQNYEKHQYFTLELTDIENDSVKTAFCEWGKFGHLNYGEGGVPIKEPFLELIYQQLNLKDSVAISSTEQTAKPTDAKSYLQSISDSKLIELIYNPSPLYSSEVLALAREELERRGLNSNFLENEYKIITIGGLEAGSLTVASLKELFLKNLISTESLVYIASRDQWLPLNKVFNVGLWTSSNLLDSSSTNQNDSEFLEEDKRVIPNSARRWAQPEEATKKLVSHLDILKTEGRDALKKQLLSELNQKETTPSSESNNNQTHFSNSQLSLKNLEKQKHGSLLYAWLVLMVIAGLWGAGSLLNAPATTLILVKIMCSLLVSVFAVALLRWKKWGFYGFVLTATFTFIMNVKIGANILTSALFYILGIAILFVLLHSGGEKKAWRQMK